MAPAQILLLLISSPIYKILPLFLHNSQPCPHKMKTPLLFTLLLLPALSVAVSAATPAGCNRTCGPNKFAVPYPFGFSADCEIPLSCISGAAVGLGEFRVRNVTPDNLLVELPSKCRRNVSEIRELWGRGHSLTWRNGLLLQGCPPDSNCLVPTALLEERLHNGSCGPGMGNMSCLAGNGRGLMSYENVTKRGCHWVFSSFMVDATRAEVLSLDFQTVEVEWWVAGSCGGTTCVPNASCQEAQDGRGFRCRCNPGWQGDGFSTTVGGSGCKKVSFSCNPSNNMNRRCAVRNRIGVLIGGIVAGAASMAALAILCYFIREHSSSLKTQKSTKRLLSEAAVSCTVPFYPYREIERATNSFSERNRLGTGAYGTVYAGKLNNDKQVAVKKIRHRDNEGIEQVLNEIKLLSSVSHANLVQLLGCCMEKGEQILVYEFMPNGTLSQHLQRERGTGLPWTIRLTVAVDTAKAIAHLHSATPPIYHRDIKSSNILLDHSFKSKVADFGLSRMGLTESSHISTAPQGTPGYLDPQYHQNFHLSDKSDVYSFGVVLVEIITALKVVDFSREQSEVNLAALAIDKIGKGSVDEIIDPFLEPHEDAWTLSSIHKVAELAFRCLAFHRDMRPSMMDVAAELEQIRLSGWTEETNFAGSSVSSCLSLSNRSGHSQATTKKSAESRRLTVPPRSDSVILMEEVKGCSPVSVQDPWLSEQSSPSSNSLLGNMVS